MNKPVINLPKEIPVFPLSNFIIFPKTSVPLNIFEPRYIDMIDDAMKGNRMIYKVFYQETKDRSPRRENTRSLYLEIEADNELEGRIKARKLVEENTDYNIEFIELLSDKHLEYEKESGTFQVTEF